PYSGPSPSSPFKPQAASEDSEDLSNQVINQLLESTKSGPVDLDRMISRLASFKQDSPSRQGSPSRQDFAATMLSATMGQFASSQEYILQIRSRLESLDKLIETMKSGDGVPATDLSAASALLALAEVHLSEVERAEQSQNAAVAMENAILLYDELSQMNERLPQPSDASKKTDWSDATKDARELIQLALELGVSVGSSS